MEIELNCMMEINLKSYEVPKTRDAGDESFI